jgi:hypothetical protein
MKGYFKGLMIAAASVAALTGATVAAAQPAPAPAAQAPIDPARLALAHKLLDIELSQMNMPGVLRSLDEQMLSAVMKQSPNADPAMQQRLAKAAEKAQANLMPHMMDSMASGFARNLSQKELEDTVAFYSSPSGQGVLHKMPAIMGEVIGSLGEWIPKMRQDMIENLCADNGCTPAQREAMEHPAPPGPPPR